jgi:hypothetical protein
MPRSSQFQCPNDTTLGDLPAVLPSAGAYAWLAGHLCSLGRRIADAIEVLADYSAAAALYDRLSHLSDAEFGRRGLSRDSLARDVCAACDRTSARRWSRARVRP